MRAAATEHHVHPDLVFALIATESHGPGRGVWGGARGRGPPRGPVEPVRHHAAPPAVPLQADSDLRAGLRAFYGAFEVGGAEGATGRVRVASERFRAGLVKCLAPI